MAHLSIENIGPIKKIDLELNRINIFIGPQSSGKSTVAKIVSFCQWLEKDCILNQSVSHVDKEYVTRHLWEYHNMSSFFHEDSAFQYVGKGIEISYSPNKIDVKKTPGFRDMLLSKNMYLPSERNVLAIPGIYTTKLPDNYLHGFIDDWIIIREKYSSGPDLRILDLKESYFFNSKNNSDMLLLDNGRRIPLSEGSSGLQSVTPLCICIDYLTDWIYFHKEDTSAYDRKRYNEAVIARYIANQVPEEEDFLENIRKSNPERVSALVQKLSGILDRMHTLQSRESDFITGESQEFKNFFEELSLVEKNLNRPSFSNLVVEEPEKNLFPDTQIKLLYYILSKVNSERDSLIITTHSPYILYAVNNCMLASMAHKENEKEIEELTNIPKEAWIDTDKVSVWELDNGSVREDSTIQDEKGLIRDNYFDRIMHNVMADFHILIDYSR